jgi:glycosyltransferase involved in cell wall biosynthesis
VTRIAPSDLTVVIPTRDRFDILVRTLDALDAQTVTGFRTVVVVDGHDQPAFDRPGTQVIVAERGGPGVARNVGAAATSTPLVLFLGDDMVPGPTLVATHLEGHASEPAPEVGVLGSVVWHPDAAGSRFNRWLDWSATQFDVGGLVPHADAHWSRFYSCNVSLKRAWFLDAGGFDPDFTYYYEDLDCGWRLGKRGLHLRYEPDARVEHLHRYDWPAVVRRFDGIAEGEQLMAAKHPDFEPFFRRRAEGAVQDPPVSVAWSRLVDVIPPGWSAVRDHARRRANTRYYQQLGPRYLDRYAAAEDLADLRRYLGDAFDEAKLRGHLRLVEAEEHAAADEETFYRTSEAYLYDLTVFALSGTKVPYREALTRLVSPGSRLLDYGCGIGTDGLRLLRRGYRVEFAEFDNPSAQYLRWRLADRGLRAPVHDLDGHVPGGFDLAYAFDVIEHVDDPFGLLGALEERAGIVLVNLLEPAPDEVHPHRPLPIDGLLDHAAVRGILHYSVHHGRSHLVAYRSTGADALDRVRSRVLRRVGPRLTGLTPMAEAAGLSGPARRARQATGRVVRSTRRHRWPK